MFLRLCVLILTLGVLMATAISAQDKETDKTKTTETKPDKNKPVDPANLTAEQVAESTVFVYGGILGRQNLTQIRKTTFERGKLIQTAADGRKNTANYERYVLRGETLDKEKIRLDQAFPDARFSLIYNNDKVYGLYNATVFTPREDASKAFQNQIWHSIESLLRYKENESKIELVKREKVMGVDYYVLELSDKQQRKTTYYVSVKSLRVMMLDYESDGIKYRRKFYDYNYAQGTLVPYRSVLWANDKEAEETTVGTVTFGQKIEENLFDVS
ncbi:MAG TPA: hypothetical protein PKO33_01455 [Pyrinomonadaceae bacterium]|nr:hypothetical protein [Pyrinomonadaceae bacterium]